MKKLFALILTLALIAVMPLTAMATEEETYPSPTDKPLIVVEFDSYHTGDLNDVRSETVPVGTECTFTAPDSEYEFVGFTVEGEYEVVSGGQLIIGSDAVPTRNASRTLVLIANSDLKVTAYYDIEEDESESTETTQPTVDDDDDGDSPDTGDSGLTFWLLAAGIVGIFGCVLAVEKIVSKKKG